MRLPLILGAATFGAALAFGNAASAPASVPSAAAAPQAAAAKPPAFATCAICHKTGAGEVSPMGPNLFRVGGRKAGSLPGYAYSPAMKGSKIVWNKATLTRFVMNPKGTVPGTKMAYPGQKDPKAAAAIADYLLRLK